MRNIQVADRTLDVTYHKTLEGITLEIQSKGSGDCLLEFSPAVSLRAEVLGAELNGGHIPAKKEPNSEDQHVTMSFRVPQGSSTVRIRIRNDFGLSLPFTMPPLGSSNRGLRITSETWNARHDTLELEVSGVPGMEYELNIWNAGQIVSAEGAELIKDQNGRNALRVRFAPVPTGTYTHAKVVLGFSQK